MPGFLKTKAFLRGKNTAPLGELNSNGHRPAKRMIPMTARRPNPYSLLFIVLCALAIYIYYTPLSGLASLSLRDDMYSHIIMIPFISGFFFWADRKKIFRETAPSLPSGAFLILSAAAIYFLGAVIRANGGDDNGLFLSITSLLLFWTGSFVLSFGAKAAKAALFPIGVLAFMIPFPDSVADTFIAVLQNGSAEITDAFLWLTGVSYYRTGFVFHLPEMNIEVAKECSGIRSSIALFITGITASHIYLKSFRRKAAFISLILPVTIFKNGLRILSLTLLGAYVDEGFLQGSLHTRGGIPFFLLALVILGAALFFLRRGERTEKTQKPRGK